MGDDGEWMDRLGDRDTDACGDGGGLNTKRTALRISSVRLRRFAREVNGEHMILLVWPGGEE